MAEILYRKWRPTTFADLAGQEHISTTLKNALSSGRVAHAYLFSGPRGTGKTSTGRLLGKALNCTTRVNGEPCNQCESCLSFLSGRAMDLIEMDAASNRGIEEIRSLRDKVGFAPSGEYKVYLIDEVHMLTDAAFNALLKTLEEPPPRVVFILATTDPHKVPATIASRCQRFDFRRIPLAATVGRLETICRGEGLECETAALELIARSATGSLRDATNLLDQLATSYGNQLTVDHVRTGLGLIGDERTTRLAQIVLRKDLVGGLELIASVRDDGLDLRQFQRELVDELRNLLLVKSGLEPADGVTAEHKAEMLATVATATTGDLLRALRSFGEADLKQDPNSTLPLDIALADVVLAEDGHTGIRADGQSAATVPPATRSAPPTPVRPERVEGRSDTPSRQVASGVDSEPAPVRAVPQQPSPRREPEPFEPEPARRPAATVAATSPQPAEARTPAAPMPSGPVATNLIAARAAMRLIYESAKAVRPTLGGLLNSGCDIMDIDDTRVVFGFKFAHLADKAGQKDNLDALRVVVNKVFGQSLEVICIVEAAVEPWTHRESLNRSPLVRAAQEMGARVITSSTPEELP